MSNLTWCGFTTKHDKRWFRAVLAYFGAHPSLYKINDLVTTWWRGVIASGHEAPVWVNDVLFYWLVNCQNTRILNAMKHHKIALGRARDTPKKTEKNAAMNAKSQQQEESSRQSGSQKANSNETDPVRGASLRALSWECAFLAPNVMLFIFIYASCFSCTRTANPRCWLSQNLLRVINIITHNTEIQHCMNGEHKYFYKHAPQGVKLCGYSLPFFTMDKHKHLRLPLQPFFSVLLSRLV